MARLPLEKFYMCSQVIVVKESLLAYIRKVSVTKRRKGLSENVRWAKKNYDKRYVRALKTQRIKCQSDPNRKDWDGSPRHRKDVNFVL